MENKAKICFMPMCSYLNSSMTFLPAKIKFQYDFRSRFDSLVGSSCQPLRWSIDHPVKELCRRNGRDQAHNKDNDIRTCHCLVLCFCEVKSKLDSGDVCDDALQKEPTCFD